MSLNATLQTLASTFVDGVLDEIRRASLADLTGDTPKATKIAKAPKANGARLPRRSLSDIQTTVSSIVDLLRKHPKGMRSEQIKLALGLDVREVPRVLRQALADKKIAILAGQKRATEYGVAVVPASTSSTKAPRKATKTKAVSKKKPAAKKAAAKPAKRSKKM